VDAIIAIKWADLLESEEFTQGTDALCKLGRYCGLGVLCELAVREGIIPPPNPELSMNGRAWYGTDEFNGSTQSLPVAVLEWAGMWNSLGEFLSGRYEKLTIAQMNDALGYTFDELGRLIREHYDAL